MMRVLACVFLLLLFAGVAATQEKEKWERVYTFEDGTIAINSSHVELGDGELGRVKFRWNWSKPQSLDGPSGAKYKSRVEVVEFICTRRRYRLVSFALFDDKGKLVLSSQPEQMGEWKSVRPGGMMERLFGPACSLIAEKRDKS